MAVSSKENKKLTSTVAAPPLPVTSPTVAHRVPAAGEQVQQSGPQHEAATVCSQRPPTSLLRLHRPPQAAVPSLSQHLPAGALPSQPRPGPESGPRPGQRSQRDKLTAGREWTVVYFVFFPGMFHKWETGGKKHTTEQNKTIRATSSSDLWPVFDTYNLDE